MALASRRVGQSGYTEIQVINALANFFKHHDEWKASWADLKGQQKQTADIIAAIGVHEFSTGQFRTGLKALGIDYAELHLLAEAVKNWASAVHRTYENELEQQGLL